MDVLEEALAMQRQGVDVVHMEVGEPDFPPPQPVVEAMHKALRDGRTHYTHSLGLWELREAVARWYHETYAVTVDPGRVIITPGTSGAFLNTMAVLLDPGDRLAMTDPGYPCYPNFARLLCITPHLVPVEPEDGFVLRKERIARAVEEGAKVVMAASPANPTGAVLPPDLLAFLCHLPVPFVSDEIYHGLCYGCRQAACALQFSDDAIVINGLSKRMAMTGLRIGWAIVPGDLVRPFQKINQNVFICPDSVSQYGAVTALSDPACQEAARDMARVYGQRRLVLLNGLKKLGFVIHGEPEGAFYVFADVSPFGLDGYDFAMALLREAHVAATPGVDFGGHHTQRFVRFAYTTDQARIEEGLARMGRFLERLADCRKTPGQGTAP